MGSIAGLGVVPGKSSRHALNMQLIGIAVANVSGEKGSRCGVIRTRAHTRHPNAGSSRGQAADHRKPLYALAEGQSYSYQPAKPGIWYSQNGSPTTSIPSILPCSWSTRPETLSGPMPTQKTLRMSS